MSFTEHNQDGLVYMSSDIITARHAFTTRYGGVSRGGLRLPEPGRQPGG